MKDFELIKKTDYFAMFLFLAISGGQYFYIINGRYFVPLFLLFAMYYHYKQNGKFVLNKSSRFYILTIGYFLINYFIINPNHTLDNTFFPQMLLFLGSYFFITSFTFEKFKVTYLNTMAVMAVISLIIFMIVEAGILSPSEVSRGGRSFLLLFFHNVGWKELFGRLAGIYWEPGAYQIVLNMTFFLYLKEIISWDLSKSVKKKMCVVLLASVMTKSTAGFLMLAILIGYILLNKIRIKRFGLSAILSIIVSLAGVYILLQSDVVQEKLGQEDVSGSSYEIRKADNLAMLQMTIERPIFGYGIDSKEREAKSIALDNHTSSNGILSMISTFGLLYFLIYYVFLYRGVATLYERKMAMFVTLMFLFLNAFEVFWYFPLAFLFHYQYKRV